LNGNLNLKTKMTKSAIEDREDGSGLEVVEIRTSTILLLVAQRRSLRSTKVAQRTCQWALMGAMAPGPVGVTVVGAVQTALSAVPLSAEPENGLTVADAENVA
jgi:hypothetical protein